MIEQTITVLCPSCMVTLMVKQCVLRGKPNPNVFDVLCPKDKTFLGTQDIIEEGPVVILRYAFIGDVTITTAFNLPLGG